MEITKTEETKIAYLKRASQLADRYQRETGNTWMTDPMDWVNWLDELRMGLKKASWRQYKAAAAFMLEVDDDGTDEQLGHAREKLVSLNQGKCKKKSHKTSARRLRNLSDIDMSKIISRLNPHSKKHDFLLITWLNAGIITGLRPHEWWHASLDGTILEVHNSKNSNGRSNGNFRYLDLAAVTKSELADIERMLLLVRDVWTDYNTAYNSASSRLKRVTKIIWPKSKRRPTLYSCRHQFRANAASAGISLEIQGALMGHGSADTARRHYGRKRFGSGVFKVKPAPNTMIPDFPEHTMRPNGSSPSLSP